MSDSTFTDAPDPFDDFTTIDTTNMTPDSVQKGGGGTVDAEGKYHFIFQDVVCEVPDMDKDVPNAPSVRFDLKVLNADYATDQQAAQVDKMLFHRIYLAKKKFEDGEGGKKLFAGFDPPTEGQRKNIAKLALRFGLITEDQIGGSLKILKAQWESLKGRTCHGEVKFEKGTSDGKGGTYKDKYDVPYSEFLPSDHPDCANWPKDEEALSLEALGQNVDGAGVDASDFDEL